LAHGGFREFHQEKSGYALFISIIHHLQQGLSRTIARSDGVRKTTVSFSGDSQVEETYRPGRNVSKEKSSGAI
jgi:hypothetical protein